MLCATTWADISSALEVLFVAQEIPDEAVNVWVESVMSLALATTTKRRGSGEMILDWDKKTAQRDYIKTLLVPHHAHMWKNLGARYNSNASRQVGKGKVKVDCESKKILLTSYADYKWGGKKDGVAPVTLDTKLITADADKKDASKEAVEPPQKKQRGK
jgi:hypothetical protein